MKAIIKTKEQLKKDGFTTNGSAWYPKESSYGSKDTVSHYNVTMGAGKSFPVTKVNKESGEITVQFDSEYTKTYPFSFVKNAEQVVKSFKAPTGVVATISLQNTNKKRIGVDKLRDGTFKFGLYNSYDGISKTEAKKLAKFLAK